MIHSNFCQLCHFAMSNTFFIFAVYLPQDPTGGIVQTSGMVCRLSFSASFLTLDASDLFPAFLEVILDNIQYTGESPNHVGRDRQPERRERKRLPLDSAAHDIERAQMHPEECDAEMIVEVRYWEEEYTAYRHSPAYEKKPYRFYHYVYVTIYHQIRTEKIVRTQ